MSPLKSKILLSALLSGAIFAPIVSAQHTQDEPVLMAALGDDEIIVYGTRLSQDKFSGTKTNTPVLDVPQSLSITTAAAIEEQGFTSIGDILAFTPGASIAQGEGHRDQITLRGQGSTGDFFINGLRDDVQYYRPLYNIEQVEILRGSNAMMFGRGGAGGVINRVTKSPKLGESFNAVAASVDTFGAASVSVDSNFEISETAGARVNAYYEELAGHRDFYDGERFAVNPVLGFELTPETNLKLSYEYVSDDRVVDRGVPSLDGAPLKGYADTFFGDPELNVTTLTANIARARLDHSFSDNLSANATVQYADYDKAYQNIYPIGIDLDAATVSLDGYQDKTQRENVIVQGNLIALFETGSLSHTLLVGAEYANQDTKNARADAFFTDSADDQITFAFTDPLNVPDVSFPELSRDRASDVRVASVYVQDQIDIGAHWKVIAGLRFDRFDIDVFDAIEFANGDADGHDGNLSRVDEEVSPRLGLIYKPHDSISLYGSYSYSFLPSSGGQFSTLSLTTAALAPQEFENYEIGVKWDFTPDLSFTGALFQLDQDSGTATDPLNPENTILVGSETKGLELQIQGEVRNGWSFNAGYSHLDGVQRGNIDNGVIDNNTLSKVPEHMASLWTRYDVNERLGLGLGASYQSEQYTSLSNTVELPSFTRVDAAAYYDVNDAVSLQVNINNLLDTDYFPSAHNDNNITTGAPRSARVTVKGKF